MKKYLNTYLIFSIFLLLCTGCNNHSNFMHFENSDNEVKYETTKSRDGTVYIQEESDSKTKKENFNVGDIKFGPDEIKFGAEGSN